MIKSNAKIISFACVMLITSHSPSILQMTSSNKVLHSISEEQSDFKIECHSKKPNEVLSAGTGKDTDLTEHIFVRNQTLYGDGSYWVMRLKILGFVGWKEIRSELAVQNNVTNIHLYLSFYKILQINNNKKNLAEVLPQTPFFSHNDALNFRIFCHSNFIHTLDIQADMINTKMLNQQFMNLEISRYITNHDSPLGYFTSPTYPYGYKGGTRTMHKIKSKSARHIVRIHLLDVMFTPFGFVCSIYDDNLRIRGSNIQNERFEYAHSIGIDTMCDLPQMRNSPSGVTTMNVSGFEYIFIQFNAVHSTISHRGYAIAYEVTNEIFYKNTFTSEARAIIIGTSFSILVVLGSIVSLVLFIVYRRKRECGNQDVIDGGVQQVYPSEGEQTTRNITSSHSKGYEDTDSQTIDICGGEGGNQSGLVALDADHLSQLNKMFSVTIGQNTREEEKEDHDDEKIEIVKWTNEYLPPNVLTFN